MAPLRSITGVAFVAAVAMAAAARLSAAQSLTRKAIEDVAGLGPGCASTAPKTPFNASLVGSTYSGAFECYRPRSPLKFIIREKAIVMTDEDGYYNQKCLGEVIALRFDRAWTRPYFNVKLSVDIREKFGDWQLPARFGDSCNKVREELGIKDVQYQPWGGGRPQFVSLLCLMVRFARRLRDFRCDTINGPRRFEPPVLDTPLASLVTFLETVAYLYNVPV
ncbi:hypothetical protein MMPV_002374 [Pyropia vietnamensis]